MYSEQCLGGLDTAYVLATGFPGAVSGKEPACQCRRHKRRKFDPWAGKIPWRRAGQPTPLFLPGESHGERSLAGYSPRGRRVGHDWVTQHSTGVSDSSHSTAKQHPGLQGRRNLPGCCLRPPPGRRAEVSPPATRGGFWGRAILGSLTF